MTTKKREKRVAQRYGGRAQPASGARPGFKRDVREPGVFLMEHKATSKETYRLDIRDFLYLERQSREPLVAYVIAFAAAEIAIVPYGWVPAAPSRIIRDKYSYVLRPEDVGKTLCFTASRKWVSVISEPALQALLKEIRCQANT